MSVQVLIITHGTVGSALLSAATKAFGCLPLPTVAIPINNDCDPDVNLEKIKSVLLQLETDDGILILTDLFGSTPCNLARCVESCDNICMVSGINLPMLMRVMNYPNLELTELAQKALSGGRDGVLNCQAMAAL